MKLSHCEQCQGSGLAVTAPGYRRALVLFLNREADRYFVKMGLHPCECSSGDAVMSQLSALDAAAGLDLAVELGERWYANW